MKESMELTAQKEITNSYKTRLVELEDAMQADKQAFEKKKGILKKKLAEAEWLNGEYSVEINTLKSQLKERNDKIEIIEKELGKKNEEFQGTVKQLHSVFEKQKIKVKEGSQKEQKLQQTIKELYQKQSMMTPRKPRVFTSTPKANSTFSFPATSPRLTEHDRKPSISDLLMKAPNPMRSSDSLIMNSVPLQNSGKKMNIPRLNLDTVFANENEEELSNFQNVEQADVQNGEAENEANNENDGEVTKKAKVNVEIDVLNEEQPEDEHNQQNDNPFGEIKEPEA